MKHMITRIYSHYGSADQAIRNLRAAGLSGGAISILAGDAEGWHEPGGRNVDPRHDKNRDGHDDRAQGAVLGGTIGMVVGAAAGFALGMHMIDIPQAAPLLAAGWYAPVVIGAFAFGALGGLMGALLESGSSRENAALHVEALKRGGALVTARVPANDVEVYAAIMDSSTVSAERQAKEYGDPAMYDPIPPDFAPYDAPMPADKPRRSGDGCDVAKTG
jgi:hypothetical protein